MNIKNMFGLGRIKKRIDFWATLDKDEIRKNAVKELFYIIPSITNGLDLTIKLLVISFIVGVGLLIYTLIIIPNDNVDNVIKIIFGSAGVINTVGFLFFYPVEKIQLTKARLAVYQAVYSTWISDLLIHDSIIKKYAENDDLDIDKYIQLRNSTTKALNELMLIINPKSDLSKIYNLIDVKEKKDIKKNKMPDR